MNGEAPARLSVRLLGAVEVVVDGQRLGAFDAPRLQRILALIALRREPQHRARIAFELWPDSNEAQARTNLRKLLHELRRSLPDFAEFVETDGETVSLSRTGTVDVDAWRLRDALAVGALELAARQYTGDLVPGCYDDWLLAERDQLRAEVHDAFVRAGMDASERGDHDAALRHAQRILELQPTDEVAVRLEMEAHIARGDRAAALRAYHRCVETLERELAVEPGGAIARLYHGLRATAANHVDAGSDDPEPIAESPFVGRDVELDRLTDAWHDACRGRPHLVVVTGEPGIGKSRLASELGRRARAEGGIVASARAYEAAGRLPWGPVVDLLRSDDLRAQVDALESVWRAELARLLPELGPTSGPPGPTASGDPVQRHRLFDAVGRALVGDRPRLLIIDDLQWCDQETIELIGFVVRAERTEPLLVVGTVRAEEVPEGHPLDAIVGSLNRDHAVTTLSLDPLDESATATLAARLGANETVDPGVSERLWHETEGNPLFVVEAIRAAISSGEDGSMVTPTMRSVLLARLSQLPDGARGLAENAAVIGRPFSSSLLVSITGMGEDEVVDLIDELWRRRIIREEGLTYDFSHDKLRAVALERVSPARRRRLHRKVAETMVAEIGDGGATQVAAHYDQAGLIGPAIDAYRTAGARAVAVSALDEAVTLFRRALSLLTDVSPSPDRDALELEVRMALGSPLVALEGYGSESAHRLYERARSLCRRLDRPVDPPILRGLGLARLQGCRFDDSSHLGQALLDHESRDPVARTEGRYLLGVSAFWRGDLAAARHHLEAAIETYDTVNRSEHLALFAQDPKAVCLVRLAWVELWAGEPGRAEETALAAVDLAVDLDHLATSAYVLTYASMIAAESEDLARLAELLDALEAVWGRVPLPYLMIVGEALRGWLDVADGGAGGFDRIVRSVTRSRAEGETLHLTYVLLLLARARGLTGEFRPGRVATREALEWSERHDQHYLVPELWRVDGALAYRSGDADAAVASWRLAVETASARDAGWLRQRALRTVDRLPEGAVRGQLDDLAPDGSGAARSGPSGATTGFSGEFG